MHHNVVRVEDIPSSVLQPPFSLGLARAVTDHYLVNGADYVAVHAAPHDVARFLLTGIVDETTPARDDPEGKLMVQGGTQYGCSARGCSFCVYAQLPFHRDLALREIVDLFRMNLLLHSRVFPHDGDKRKLTLKFTDNGEPLESPLLPDALTALVELFGVSGKVLRFKISTILHATIQTRETLARVFAWQADNRSQASIHLQISRPLHRQDLFSPEEVRDVITAWHALNPDDPLCIAPGLTHGIHQRVIDVLCDGLAPVREQFFFRPSVFKPSSLRQERVCVPPFMVTQLCDDLVRRGFDVRPLPDSATYTDQLRGAGTLSHKPNGLLYDSTIYQVWQYDVDTADPNVPLPLEHTP